MQKDRLMSLNNTDERVSLKKIKGMAEWIQLHLKKGMMHSMLFIVIIFVLLLALFKSIFYTILPGEAGVRWRRFYGGTQVDRVYSEGWNVIAPYDKMYIYNIRIQELSHEMDVLTKNGLKVHLNLSIRYAPKVNLLALLHQKVGPDYPNAVIIPEVEAVLREIIGTMDVEDIYTTGRVLIVEAINKAIEQVAQRYIDVDDVLIKSIELPESVAKAIRYKMEQKQLMEAHDFIVEKEKKEAERKRIEAVGVKDYNKIVEGSISDKIIDWKSIQATLELSKSNNAKVIVVGAGKRGLPIIGEIPMDASTVIKESQDEEKRMGTVEKKDSVQ